MWKSAVLVVLCGSCISPGVPGSKSEAPLLFSKARAAITRDDWEDAAVCLARFLRERPDHPYALQARYLLGTYYLRERDLEGARDEFTFVADHAGHTRLGRHARIRIGDTALAGGSFDEAAAVFLELLAHAGRYHDGPELTFKLGVVRQRQGRWTEADALFQQVRDRYPHSVFAARAAEQLTVPHHFSLQVGAFRERKNAESKQEELSRRGHRAQVCQFKRHGRSFWCVRVGSFPTRQSALDFKSRLKKDPDFALADVVP